MTTCICPHCGHRAGLVHQYQETGWYHCGRCGTLAAKVGDSVRVRCLPIYGNAHEAMVKALQMVRSRWTFDNYQIHTHSWHDWADCKKLIDAALAAVEPPK